MESLVKINIRKAQVVGRFFRCSERIMPPEDNSRVHGVFTEPDYSIVEPDCRLRSGQPDTKCSLQTCPKN